MEKNKKRKYTKRILIVGISLFIYSILNYVSLRGEYLSIKGISDEYIDIFFVNQRYKYIVTLINFIFIYLLVYWTNKGIKKGLNKFFNSEKKEMPKLPNKTFAVVIGLIVSFISSGFFTGKYMLFANSAYFGGNNDPIFGFDIGFFIFNQPFIEAILIYLIIVFVAITLYLIAYYIIALNVYFEGIDVELLKKNNFIRQLICNIIVITILISSLIFVKAQNILIQNMITINDEDRTTLVGAGLTDATIKLWGYRFLSIIVIISVIKAITNVKTVQFKKMFMSLMIIPIYLVGLFVVMTFFQLIYVDKNNLEKEKKYIQYNIDYTKNAYNINIVDQEIDNYDTITVDQVKANTELLQNIPIIDEEVTLNTLSSYQDNEGYYAYRNTQIGMYRINGKRTSVFVTPREIISDSNRLTSNKVYRYTHGYGVVLTNPNQVDKNGYTEYIQSDFDNQNNKVYIEEPRIYFGLVNNNPIITNTNFGAEFDYPTAVSAYEENYYDGEAGLKLSIIDRFILGIHDKDMSIVSTKYLTENSKVITNRNIIQRAKTLLPYLEYDENPYMIITSDGKLVWVIDAYTVSDKYPYSQYTYMEKSDGTRKKINYIRNSVKVFVDAYDGTTTFYITDKTDPIIIAYKNIYPTLFKELDEVTISKLSEHFVYPKKLYDIQAKMLEKYHSTNVEVLYRADDIWKIAEENLNTNSKTKLESMDSYYTVLNTIDDKTYKLGLVLPYTKSGKQNLNAYLVGSYKNGSPELKMYKFSSNTSVAGIMQLSSQIEQDETISQELQAITVTGTKLTKKMIIVPINNTLLYVEPVYQVMLNDKLQVPVLRRVIVASGNKVTIGNNFEDALNKLLSESAIDLEIIDTANLNELIDSIIKANNNLKESEKASDLEMMGKDIRKLQELVDSLEVYRKKELQNKNAQNKDIKIPLIDSIIQEP